MHFAVLCCHRLLQLPLRAKVEAISFSAHADFDQTRQFLEELAPPHVVLVHGEFNEMMRLRTVSMLAYVYVCVCVCASAVAALVNAHLICWLVLWQLQCLLRTVRTAVQLWR
jgi:hypothetical protein